MNQGFDELLPCEDNAAVDSYKSIQNFFSAQCLKSCAIPIDSLDLKSCSDIHSILRPYQEETVRWMVMRERKRQQLHLGEWRLDLPLGGILADEMGLGKTVEVLACMLSNPNPELNLEPASSVNDPVSNSVDVAGTSRKRPTSEQTSDDEFLRKKPKLSNIKQNPTMKYEIHNLTSAFYSDFERKILKKVKQDKYCKEFWNNIQTGFNVILLNKYYDKATSSFAKTQIWASLVSQYDVHEPNAVARCILQNVSSKNPCKIANVNPIIPMPCVNAIQQIVCDYLDEKVLKRFDKQIFLKMRFSINMSGGEYIPLLEDDSVKCSCGSDKAKGAKIQCNKCQSWQHRRCVGLETTGTRTIEESRYLCPNCWMTETPIDSAATLIVIPSTLTQQWFDEIEKHTSGCHLKVYWYKGVKEGYILPPKLASYDIVLANFNTLAGDLWFTTNQTRNLRHVKRYQSFITPLTCIKWWRLCIDEAQTVESINKVSTMAALLKTEHLWAVTGTPIGSSLHDLYGLCAFLRMEPFLESEQTCWNYLISGDQSMLHELFGHIMRRKTKSEISDQLGLPELKIEITWLSLSPTEGYFYNIAHEACEKTFKEKIKKIKDINQPLKQANRASVNAVLAPLLSLRQACVNPMAVSNSTQLNLREGESMKELLVKMIQKTKVDCEDILRLYIMLVNGVARLTILGEKFFDAVILYRSLLMKIKLYEDLKPDNFQIMHIMHNLYETALKNPKIELSEEELNFPQKIEELERNCFNKLQEEVDTLKEQLTKHQSELSSYTNLFKISQFSWWDNMIENCHHESLISRVKDALENQNIDCKPQLLLKLSTLARIRESLKYWFMQIDTTRSLIFEFLEKITSVSNREALWNAADNCHINVQASKRTCAICKMDDVMRKYENLLFSASKAENVETNWKPNAMEYVLNDILNQSRSKMGTTTDIANATHQMKILGVLKKEFRTVRVIWREQRHLVDVFDEVRTAKSTVDPNNTNCEIFQSEILVFQNQIHTYETDSANAYAKLQSKYGSLQYLKNLERKYLKEGSVEEACPVCHTSVDEKRAVMICGHFTCYGCMQELLKHCHRENVDCPICRSVIPFSLITYVHGGGKSAVDISSVEGNYSIKNLAITAKILELVKADSEVKILLFSTWDRALDIMERCLKQNGVLCQRYKSSGRKSSLAHFKNNKSCIHVLLMPLSSGGKGLNITEANHLIFMEPVLHLADEKQAIGRIYRLGQTRNMVVHKFVVKSTIEQHLHNMTEELLNSNYEYELTFRHLHDLVEASSSNSTNV